MFFRDKICRRFSNFIATNIFEEIISFEQKLKWEFPSQQKNKLNTIQYSKVLNKLSLAQQTSNDHSSGITTEPSINRTSGLAHQLAQALKHQLAITLAQKIT